MKITIKTGGDQWFTVERDKDEDAIKSAVDGLVFALTNPKWQGQQSKVSAGNPKTEELVVAQARKIVDTDKARRKEDEKAGRKTRSEGDMNYSVTDAGVDAGIAAENEGAKAAA